MTRSIDSENRSHNKSWESEYSSANSNRNLQCLVVCMNVISVPKEYNTKHITQLRVMHANK